MHILQHDAPLLNARVGKRQRRATWRVTGLLELTDERAAVAQESPGQVDNRNRAPFDAVIFREADHHDGADPSLADEFGDLSEVRLLNRYGAEEVSSPGGKCQPEARKRAEFLHVGHL